MPLYPLPKLGGPYWYTIQILDQVNFNSIIKGKKNIYGLEQGYDINFGLGLLQLQLKIWFISWVKDIQ